MPPLLSWLASWTQNSNVNAPAVVAIVCAIAVVANADANTARLKNFILSIEAVSITAQVEQRKMEDVLGE